MIVRTNNSTYELNSDDKLIRRTSGFRNPTLRQGSDGEWKKYDTITKPTVGEGLVIVWRFDPGPDSIIARSTVTSPIIEIITNQ